MSITPDEFIRRLAKVRIDLDRTRKRDAQVIGLDIVGQVKRRVTNTGFDHEGQSFGIYSKSYQKLRAKKNLTSPPFPNVNFKFTSRMMNNTTAQIVKSDRYAVTVRLAPTQSGEQQKLEWNEERFGDIINLNRKENDRLTRAIEKRYRRILINNNIF